MAENMKKWREVSNPKNEMPESCNVIEFGSEEKNKYRVEVSNNARQEVPLEIKGAVIKAYDGGIESIKGLRKGNKEEKTK